MLMAITKGVQRNYELGEMQRRARGVGMSSTPFAVRPESFTGAEGGRMGEVPELLNSVVNSSLREIWLGTPIAAFAPATPYEPGNAASG